MVTTIDISAHVASGDRRHTIITAGNAAAEGQADDDVSSGTANV